MADNPFVGGGSGGGATPDNPFAGGGSAASAKKGGGGILGGVESFAHVVAAKAELAGHDLKTIPGGLIQAGGAFSHDLVASVEHPERQVGPSWGSLKHPLRPTDEHGSQLWPKVVEPTIAGVKQSAQHPLRDPFLTAVNLIPFLRGAGGLGLRGAAAAKAADAGAGLGDVVKAAARKPSAGPEGVLGPRLINVGDAHIPLHASANPAMRLVQAGYDKVIQHAIDTNPDGRLASHGTKRVAGSLAETQRYQTRMREAPAGVIEQAGVKLGPRRLSPRRAVTDLAPRKVQEAALRLTSENSTAEEASAFHRAQAAQGVAVRDNLKQARLSDQVTKHGLLTQDHEGNVIIDTAAHPDLAKLDAHIAEGQAQVDEIAKQHGLMTEEQLATRRNGPARIRNGAMYETPTPGKAGVASQGLVRQRAYVARLEQLHGRAQSKADETAVPYQNVHTTPSGIEKEPGVKTPGVPSDMPPVGSSNPVTLRLGAALSVAKDRLEQMETAAANRVKPTGIVGGEDARPGRGFVTYKTQEPRAPKGAVAGAAGPVVGKLRSFITRQPFTGHGLQQGLVPDNTSRLVAANMRSAYRYVNTDSFRRTALTTGGDAKRTSRDVLMRVPDAETVDKLSPEIEDLIGRKHLTTGELDAVQHGFDAWRQHIVPGLAKDFAEDKAAGIGTAAPEGYRWVDRNILGDLAKPGPGPRLAVGAVADKINTAVTSATVYFKLGHVGTRVLTNAATNLIQGSARPTEIAKSLDLFKSLTPEERLKALAVGGHGGYHALPLTDESGVLSKGIAAAGRVGANWWAKHADAPFRFNSVAYEARKAGFDTPAKFRDLLSKLENPHLHNMDAAEAAKVDWVAKRSNREGIAYDRLSDFERRYITRAFWFYPWVAGATRFAVNTLMEHPLKTAELGNLGVQGRQEQASVLGDLPSYEQGLVKLGGSAASPLVSDFSTFSPLATPGDVLQVPSVGTATQFLNPAYAAALQLALRQNQYEQHTNKPLGSALSSLFSPTPEAQILNAYLHPAKPTQMFHKTPLNMLARAAGGPGLPRRINIAAAHKAAGLERSGR